MTRHRADANQLDLGLGPERGALHTLLNDATQILSRLIRQSELTRFALAERLSYLLGRGISESSLDAWLAQSNANRMPADVLVCLCRILGSAEPLEALLAGSAWSVADARDRAYGELGRTRIEREAIEAREAAARHALLKDGNGIAAAKPLLRNHGGRP